MTEPLFAPRPASEEGDDPRVAQFASIVRQALEAGVEASDLASALPREVLYALLLHFRAVYRTPSDLGFDLAEKASLFMPAGRAVDMALAYARSINCMLAAYDANEPEGRGKLVAAIEHQWRLLRGYVLNEVLPGHSKEWLHSLTRRDVNCLTEIHTALADGHQLMRRFNPHPIWPYGQYDREMTTQQIIEAMTDYVEHERAHGDGPPM